MPPGSPRGAAPRRVRGPMRFHLVVNPVAGRNRAGPLADDLAERLRGAGATVKVVRTAGPGDAGRLVAALAPEATDRLVVVLG